MATAADLMDYARRMRTIAVTDGELLLQLL